MAALSEHLYSGIFADRPNLCTRIDSCLLLLAGGDVELEVDHVAVLHHVVLALLAVLAGGLDFGGVRGGLDLLVVLKTALCVCFFGFGGCALHIGPRSITPAMSDGHTPQLAARTGSHRTRGGSNQKILNKWRQFLA